MLSDLHGMARALPAAWPMVPNSYSRRDEQGESRTARIRKGVVKLDVQSNLARKDLSD